MYRSMFQVQISEPPLNFTKVLYIEKNVTMIEFLVCPLGVPLKILYKILQRAFEDSQRCFNETSHVPLFPNARGTLLFWVLEHTLA